MHPHDPDHAEESGACLDGCAIPTRGYDMTPLVGLGGSTGAIEALESMLAALPEQCGVAFVVAIHLPGAAQSMPAQLRSGVTALPVVPIMQRVRVEPDHVYVLPPRRFLVVNDGYLEAVARPLEAGESMAVDVFFRTLADTHGPHSAAVVLSGGDSDGSIGVKRIKERGGLTIAQDPLEAVEASMPSAAIATGMIDWVLPVAEIGERLRAYFQSEKHLQLPSEVGTLTGTTPDATPDEAALRQVIDFLDGRTGHDFSMYKRSTVMRRIARRMQLNGIGTLPDYLHCVRTVQGESAALVQDLLTSVTNFFRDPTCFAALEAEIPELFRKKGPSDVVRVWVAACATGEEAYSIAILLSEHAGKLDAPPSLQIFATDVSQAALRTAREALYPFTIRTDVSDERLRRFFIQEELGFRVRREVREIVLFAQHNLLRDSPFSRLDLVACRNLLISLDQEAQNKVFDVLSFSLVAHGRLFLAPFEGPNESNPTFTLLDRKHRIYAKRGRTILFDTVEQGDALVASPQDVLAPAWGRTARHVPAGVAEAAGGPASVRTRSTWGELHLSLIERLAPPSILIDDEHDIVHLSPTAGRYLEHGAGEPSRNLLRLVPPALRIELRAALLRAAQTGQSIETPEIETESEGTSGRVSLKMRVVPVREGGSPLSLVLLGEFVARPAPAAMQPVSPDATMLELDRELDRLKAHLRETILQYEGSAQELKASNEELQAINEELRLAAEELETGREELQSVNEELTAVNQELKVKVNELALTNSDMQNLMNATAIATIFLDRDLRIARYTPTAVALFNFIPGDVGRPLSDLTPRLNYPELAEDAARVLERLVPLEREVGMAEGDCFLARLLPYRTMEDRIAGVVLSFIDITERKRAEEVSQWLSAVVASSMDAIISFSLQGTVLSWNGGAKRVFGYAAEEVIGQPLSVLADRQRLDEVASTLDQIGRGLNVENLETIGRAKDGSVLHLSLTASPITNPEGRLVGGTASVRDIGDAKRGQEALRRSEERLRLVIENARDYAIFSTDVNRIITSWNKGAERLLGYSEAEAIGCSGDMIFTLEDRAGGAPEREAQVAMVDEGAADERIHVRKDGSRFWASGTLMRMDDSAGGAIGFVKILRDETEARNARFELQRSQEDLLKALKAQELARAQLEKADAAKDRFLAVLSHELRNPLAAVLTASELLASPAAPEDEQARAAALVQRQARTMKSLLDDLLDVSRLAVGRLELRMRDVLCSDLVDSALEAVESTMSRFNHRLHLDLPSTPVTLHGDPLRLSQVLVNLLGNAAKYTPPGGDISLGVRATGEQVCLEVIDDGIGMDAERIEQMFELYAQGPRDAHALNDGLGVGLSLVRTIVDLHGGSVEGSSDGPGRGSRFVVRLPRWHTGASPALPAPTEQVGAAQDILVVDDNKDAAWAMAQLLQRAGHRTRLAHSGAEALETILSRPPDAAVLDIGMPDLDGIEVARRLRADATTSNMVLIALTGWGGEAARARAIEAGFDGLLSKPTDLQELLAAMRAAAKERSQRGPPSC